MSKVCKNCGVKHYNSAVRCAMCHTEFNDAHIYAKRRRLIILAVCFTLLIASAISYAVYSKTPQAAVRNIMNAYKKADVDTVLSYYPDFYLESDKLDYELLLLNIDFGVKKMSEELYTFYLEDPATPSERECNELIETFKYTAARISTKKSSASSKWSGWITGSIFITSGPSAAHDSSSLNTTADGAGGPITLTDNFLQK